MIRWRLMLVLLTILVGVSASLALDAHQVFRGRADIVTLDVVVKENGTVVRGLTRDDFEVLDRGVKQTIDSAEHTGSLAMAIAVDLSASVQFGRLEYGRRLQPAAANLDELVRAAGHVLGASPADDVVSLLVFAAHPVLLARHVNASDVVAMLARSDWRPTAPQVRSAVWDAVLAATSTASGGPGRPVVWLFSDGVDNASWLRRDDVRQVLEQTGITVDMVVAPQTYDTLDDAPPGYEDPAILSRQSGGVVLDVRDRQLAQKLQSRVAALRASYRLTYVPRGVGRGDGWHDVTVRIPGRRMSVEVRPGYFSGR